MELYPNNHLISSITPNFKGTIEYDSKFNKLRILNADGNSILDIDIFIDPLQNPIGTLVNKYSSDVPMMDLEGIRHAVGNEIYYATGIEQMDSLI